MEIKTEYNDKAAEEKQAWKDGLIKRMLENNQIQVQFETEESLLRLTTNVIRPNIYYVIVENNQVTKILITKDQDTTNLYKIQIENPLIIKSGILAIILKKYQDSLNQQKPKKTTVGATVESQKKKIKYEPYIRALLISTAFIMACLLLLIFLPLPAYGAFIVFNALVAAIFGFYMAILKFMYLHRNTWISRFIVMLSIIVFSALVILFSISLIKNIFISSFFLELGCAIAGGMGYLMFLFWVDPANKLIKHKQSRKSRVNIDDLLTEPVPEAEKMHPGDRKQIISKLAINSILIIINIILIHLGISWLSVVCFVILGFTVSHFLTLNIQLLGSGEKPKISSALFCLLLGAIIVVSVLFYINIFNINFSIHIPLTLIGLCTTTLTLHIYRARGFLSSLFGFKSQTYKGTITVKPNTTEVSKVFTFVNVNTNTANVMLENKLSPQPKLTSFDDDGDGAGKNNDISKSYQSMFNCMVNNNTANITKTQAIKHNNSKKRDNNSESENEKNNDNDSNENSRYRASSDTTIDRGQHYNIIEDHYKYSGPNI